ncbi:nuclear envelope pore membrane protein POM 121 isoform X1 [Polyodon spathula]|uniref:nuclear envelope pore membrane protein POM 121 isoform X1 n=1 Tax=Polyodon spathula TaxID=7913 RepID=UPI001B7F26F8|nr:nuclear envelope pore membrane protein POM 121 isoform X1 [Polyodon spathula]
MYPREKRLIALVSVAILGLALYFIPTFLYVLFIIGLACAALFCQTNGPPQQSRLGHHPRPHLVIPPAIRRWFPGKPANGVSSPGKVSNRGTRGRFIGDSWQSVVYSGERRKEADRDQSSGSLLFSPRDLLMGSYLAKPESPSAAGAHGRPIGGTRELRERLARPNHIVQTPNKRLSFGESMNAARRFSVTPQRCYPIQQTGYSSVGVLPSVQWNGYRKKNVLLSRNSSMVHSPVTVKIARPDSGSVRSPLFEHLPSPVASLSPVVAAGSADPCSKETVLSALKESRKRVADEEEERCYSAGQEKKRRRHDSGGSAHSAFEPLLANGAPSLLVPKPGTLKRSANSLVLEDPSMKRSRTSSISSLNCTAPSGVPGSVRNSIHSSYSSTRGYSQLRKISALNMSPLSSPGSSRSQTPERSPKKPREENSHHSSTSTPVKPDRTPEELAKKLSPLLNQTASSSCSTPPSAGAHGKRKRKIPLVSNRRADQITLPPPPELGYTITASDLDSEKKAALNRIKKVLEEIEPSKSMASSQSVASFTPTTSYSLDPTPSAIASLPLSSSTATVPSSTVAGITSLPASSSSAATAPTGSLLNSVIASASATAVTTSASTVTTLPSALPAGSQPSPSPLLDSLRKMHNTPATTTAAATTASPATTTDAANTLLLSLLRTSAAPGSTLTSTAAVKPQPSTCFPSAPAPQLGPPSSQPASSILSSVFSQVLPESSTAAAAGGMTFGLSSMGHSTVPSSSSSSSSTAAATTSSTQAFSAFKPVFGAPAASQPTPVSAPASSSAAPIFKSVFGTATTGSAFGQPSAKASTAGSNSVFGGLSSTTAPPPTAELPAKPNFSFGASPASTVPTGSSSTTTSAGATQSFQFGAATTTFNSTAGFQFGKQPAAASSTAAPAATAPAPAPQVTFAFGQTLNSQTAASGAFGGFGTAAPAPATTAAPANKATFSFGNAVPATFSAATSSAGTATPFGGMGATTNPTLFGSASTGPAAQPAAVAPFPFGGGTAATTFSFGGQTTTAASTFGTPSLPAFGNTSTGFSFGTNTSSSATPAFGSSTQTSSANTAAPSAFGSTAPAATAGFSFGAAAQSSSAASAFLAPSTRQSTAPKPSTAGFNFGNTFAAPAPAATSSMENKPAFGGSASPAFGQSTPGGPIPFGSPATPAPNYSSIAPSPFGSPTPSFSIGAGSKPSGRQRLMARRQHTRKK